MRNFKILWNENPSSASLLISDAFLKCIGSISCVIVTSNEGLNTNSHIFYGKMSVSALTQEIISRKISKK